MRDLPARRWARRPPSPLADAGKQAGPGSALSGKPQAAESLRERLVKIFAGAECWSRAGQATRSRTARIDDNSGHAGHAASACGAGGQPSELTRGANGRLGDRGAFGNMNQNRVRKVQRLVSIKTVLVDNCHAAKVASFPIDKQT